MIVLRNAEELAKIKAAAQLVKASLDAVEAAVRPGISTWELNEIAEQTTLKLGGKPAFKGYRGFPACLCVSVNNEVVHGIPRKDRILKEGDVVGIDYGVNLNGYFGDSARTLPVGFEPTGRLKELLDSTQEALHRGIAAIRDGGCVRDISRAIDSFITPKGFGIVRDYVGHGIGSQPHEDPPIPHYDTGDRGAKLRAGMVICIEPMINMGSEEVSVLKDGWTVVTVDGSWSAHFEHTVAITEAGPEVLSA
jgi:methionyl aminopeptidase